MTDFLKGNFKVKRAVKESLSARKKNSAQELKERLRKKALASIGGSMVYVERTELTWNGDEGK